MSVSVFDLFKVGVGPSSTCRARAVRLRGTVVGPLISVSDGTSWAR